MVLPWRIKRREGGAWVDNDLRSWNGSSFIAIDGYYWDGSDWVIMTDRTPPTNYYESYYASHYGQTYNGSNTKRTDAGGLCYQGNSGSGVNGIQKSMWGTDVNMQAGIAGSVAIHDAYLYLNNNHTYWNAGGTAVLGTHGWDSGGGNNGVSPSTYQGNRHSVQSVHFNKGEEKWVQISTDWGWWAADGSFRGPVIFVNSSNVEYYGYYTSSVTVQIRHTK